MKLPFSRCHIHYDCLHRISAFVCLLLKIFLHVYLIRSGYRECRACSRYITTFSLTIVHLNTRLQLKGFIHPGPTVTTAFKAGDVRGRLVTHWFTLRVPCSWMLLLSLFFRCHLHRKGYPQNNVMKFVKIEFLSLRTDINCLRTFGKMGDHYYWH